MAEPGDFSIGKRGPWKQFRLPDPSYYHPDMWDRRSKYTPHEKLQAVTVYTITGRIDEASAHSGVPEGTIAGWKRKTEWFPAMVAQVREQLKDELDAELTEGLHTAVSNIKEILTQGEQIYDRKTGKFIRKQMSGKDTAVVAAIRYDKRALARGEATARTETKNTSTKLEELQAEFKKFAAAETIDGEVVTETADG